MKIVSHKYNLVMPIRIQRAFPQVGITGNQLHYANVDFEFPLEVQQYGTT